MAAPERDQSHLSARYRRHLVATYKPGTPVPDTLDGIGEANVVNGHALARAIDRFCKDWDATRPIGYPFNSDKVRFFGATGWLAQETGVNVRTISRIRNGQVEHVNMSRADSILQAIGDGTRLDGALEPYPNPRWSVERWRAYMAERGCI